mmetsp:Transcript_14956/g.18494  ORF Transcript_14956/g.18494 Transcript_14956/m.18494 type:complete len:105 (-) Transcript_14956:400-714(-)
MALSCLKEQDFHFYHIQSKKLGTLPRSNGSRLDGRWIPFKSKQKILNEFPVFQAGLQLCLRKDEAQFEAKLLNSYMDARIHFNSSRRRTSLRSLCHFARTRTDP